MTGCPLCPFVTEAYSRALCDTGALLCPEATVTSGGVFGHRGLVCHCPRAPFSGGSSGLRTSAGQHDRHTQRGEGESQLLAHPGAAEPEEVKDGAGWRGWWWHRAGLELCQDSPLHAMPPLSHRWTSGSPRTSSTAQMPLLRQQRQQPWASRCPRQGHRAMSHPCRAPAVPQAPHLPRPSAGLSQCWKCQSLGKGPGPARKRRGKSAIPSGRARGETTWSKSFPKGKSAQPPGHPRGKTTATEHPRRKTGAGSRSGRSGSTPTTRSSCGTLSRTRGQLLLPPTSRCQQQGHRAVARPAPAALPVPHGASGQPRPSGSCGGCTGSPPGGLCRLCAPCSGAPAWSCSWMISAHCLTQISSLGTLKLSINFF